MNAILGLATLWTGSLLAAGNAESNWVCVKSTTESPATVTAAAPSTSYSAVPPVGSTTAKVSRSASRGGIVDEITRAQRQIKGR